MANKKQSPVKKDKKSDEASKGTSTTIDVSPYVEDGRLKPIPRSMLSTLRDANAVLNAVEEYFGEWIEGDDQEGNIFSDKYDAPTRCLDIALAMNCLSLEQIVSILRLPIDYRSIYKLGIGELVALPYAERLMFGEAQFIDALLFLIELHDPRQNHLSKARRKYDMSYFGGKDYKKTPEALVATVAWEKKLRGNKSFYREFLNLHKTVLSDAPYWMFCVTSRYPEGNFWFYAFDENRMLDIKTSIWLTDIIRDTCIDDEEGMGFIEFCVKYSLEMIGTPFYPYKETNLKPACHFLAQQMSVTWRNNSYEVLIPAFYRHSHIEGLIDTDFADLQFALKSGLRFGAIQKASTSSRDDSPMAKSDMGCAAKVIYDTLKVDPEIGKADAFWYTAKAVSRWWGSMPPAVNETLRGFVSPSKGYDDKGRAKAIWGTSPKAVLDMVTDRIKDKPLPPVKRHAFDRLCGIVNSSGNSD